MQVIQPKRFACLLLFLLVTTLYFWSQSRVPALDEKLQMGSRTLVNVLAFDPLIEVGAHAGWVERVLANWLNWLYTNWQGMTFGLLVAAILLALLPLLRFHRAALPPLLQSLLGAGIGVPLGVCANCATPIAYGLATRGAPLALSMASLMSSPTLNVIVLSMAFTLLPWHLVVLQLCSLGVVLLVLLPLLAKRHVLADAAWLGQRVAKPQGAPLSPSPAACELSAADQPPAFKSDAHWYLSLIWALRECMTQLVYVLKRMLPLMLVAGFLAAVLVECLPDADLSEHTVSWLALAGAALVALFLPVPMAFDVLMASILLAAGLPLAFVAVIWFCLGIFSIYPSMVFARAVSWQFVVQLWCALLVTALVLGYAAQFWSDVRYQAVVEEVSELQSNSGEPPRSLMPLVTQALQSCRSFLGTLPLADDLPKHKPLPNSAGQCVESVLAEAFADPALRGVCEHLPDTLAPQCQSLRHRQHVTARAVDAHKAELCSGLDKHEVGPCLVQVAIEHSIDTQNIAHCSLLSEQAAAHCQQEVIALYLELYDSRAICQRAPASVQAQCESEWQLRRAVTSNDVAACEQFVDRQLAQRCRVGMLAKRLAQGDEAQDCAQFEAAWRRPCADLLLRHRAVREGRPELCNALRDVNLRSACYTSAILAHFRRQKQDLGLAELRSLGQQGSGC